MKILLGLISVFYLSGFHGLYSQDLVRPILTSPNDGDTISTSHEMLFSWFSLNVSTSSGQSYSLKLYKLGQSSPEGVVQIESKAPDFVERQIASQSYLLNPVSYQLASGWYSWVVETESPIQVDEGKGLVPVISEIRRFYVRPDHTYSCLVDPLPAAEKRLYELKAGRYLDLKLDALFRKLGTKRLSLEVVTTDNIDLGQKYYYSNNSDGFRLDLAEIVAAKYLRSGQRLELRFTSDTRPEIYFASVYVR